MPLKALESRGQAGAEFAGVRVGSTGSRCICVLRAGFVSDLLPSDVGHSSKLCVLAYTGAQL